MIDENVHQRVKPARLGEVLEGYLADERAAAPAAPAPEVRP